MNERRTDTVAMAHNDFVVTILLAQANPGNLTERQQRVQQDVVRVATTNGFVGGAVGDRDCRIVAQAGIPAEALTGVQRACRIAQDTGDFKIIPFGANEPRVWLGIAFPVMAPAGMSWAGEDPERVLGAVVMLAEPWQDVFRFFAKEAGPTQSAETEIVWQESGEAVALSPRRGKRGVESIAKLPLAGAAFESVVARAGKEDFGQFTDSRGITVFGVARPIGPAGASLVRKVGRDQALSEFHNRARLEGLAGALSALLSAFVIAAQRRREVIRELREIQQAQLQRQQAEEALRQSHQRYKDFITHSIEGVWRVELDHPIPVDLSETDALQRLLDYGYLAECNLAHARIMGFSSLEEVLCRRLRDLLPPPESDRDRLESFRSAARGGWRSRTLEFQGADKSGRVRHLLRTEIPIIEGGSVVRIWGITRDITEIKRAEEEVRKSEGRWRAVFENSAVGIALSELTSARFLRANLALQKMLGYSEEELQALTFMEITHDDDREGNRRLLVELEAGKRESFAIQKRYRRKDGEAIWVNLHVSKVPGTETGSRFAMAIVEDISERKRAEKSLSDSEERFRTTFENAGIGMALVDMHGRPIQSNPALEKMLGYSKEELAAMVFTEFTHPDERDTDMALYRELMAGRRNRYEIEKRYIRKDGQALWGRLIASLVRTADGKPQYGVGMVEDITERKRAVEALGASEARFRTLMERAPVAISISRQGLTLYINQKYLDMYGFHTAEEVVGRSLGEQWSADCRSMVLERARQRAIGVPVPTRYEAVGLRKDGTEFPVEITVATVDLPDGPASIGFLADITERKRAQEDLQHSFEQLRALAAGLQRVREEERKIVAREIHDQLGQALTAIKLDLSSLMRDFPTERGALSRKGLPILHLIDETIEAVRRISTELRPGMLDDLGLLATVEWATEEFEARTGTKCRLDLMPDEIAIDPETATAVFRIFQETLTNVARHAKASEVKVKISWENGSLLLEVQDNGRGIDKDELASSTSLGILGMRERAMLLGGTITISGSPAKGTLVSLRIPRAAASIRKTS